VVVLDESTVDLWDADCGTSLQTLNCISLLAFRTLEGGGGIVGNRLDIDAIVFSPDSNTLASASGAGDKSVKLWDARSGALLQNHKGHPESVIDMAFSPDGRTLASASPDSTINLWNAGSVTLRQTLDVDGIVNTFSFSNDGIHLQTNRGSLPISCLSSTGTAVTHQQIFFVVSFKDQLMYSRIGPILWLPPEHRTGRIDAYGSYCWLWLHVRNGNDHGPSIMNFLQSPPHNLHNRSSLYMHGI
jgi:WD40 repeat protein